MVSHMSVSRPPTARLRPFVSLLWASDGLSTTSARSGRELILPSGAAHLVVRLGGRPIRIFSGPDDRLGNDLSRCLIGGARASSYAKRVDESSASVGAVLRPGATHSLFRAAAGDFANRHTSLEDVWPAAAVAELRERLTEAAGLERRLSIWEYFLMCRLPGEMGLDPMIAHMLSGLNRGMVIGDLVTDIGLSHRYLAASFVQAVGLTPKLYQRVRRFNRVLGHLHQRSETPLADLAARLGYADQAHLNRDFREFAGLSPGDYRRAAPAAARHVPLPNEPALVRFLQDQRSQGRAGRAKKEPRS